MFVQLRRKIRLKLKLNDKFITFVSLHRQSCRSFNSFFNIFRLATEAACSLTGLFLFHNVYIFSICQNHRSNGTGILFPLVDSDRASLGRCQDLFENRYQDTGCVVNPPKVVLNERYGCRHFPLSAQPDSPWLRQASFLGHMEC